MSACKRQSDRGVTTSEHHSRLVALSEAAGGAILPPNFVHNAVIPPSAEVAVMACGSETEDETNAPHFNEGLILNYTSRRRRVTRAVLKGSRLMNGASAPRQRSDERSIQFKTPRFMFSGIRYSGDRKQLYTLDN